MSRQKPLKLSVALVIRSDDDPLKVLQVRRPVDDGELPGMWGLPAATCRPGETLEQAASRVGAQKLGAAVTLGPRLARGSQERRGYHLLMELVEAWLEGTPDLARCQGSSSTTLYSEWRWGVPSALEESARLGSLCSHLLLEAASMPGWYATYRMRP